MLKDFYVGQSNELVKAGRVYDIHNRYDWVELVAEKRRVTLRFEPVSEAPPETPPVVLTFEDVDALERSSGIPDRGSLLVLEMGYKNPADQDDTWLMSEAQAGPDAHLFFRFEGDEYLRVHSQTAKLAELSRKSPPA